MLQGGGLKGHGWLGHVQAPGGGHCHCKEIEQLPYVYGWIAAATALALCSLA